MRNNTLPKIIKKSCLSALLAGSALAGMTTDAHAASLQQFGPMTYFNPALMNLYCKTFNFTIGGDLAYYKGTFKGYNPAYTLPGRNPYAGSKSNDDRLLPYGQVLYRLNPRVVIGFDVSSPMQVYLKWTTGNSQGTKTQTRALNYSGKISYAFDEDWTFGVGLDVLQLQRGVLNTVVPGTGGRYNTNSGTGSRAGWDAGLTYKLNLGGWLGFAYKSRQYINSKGVSTFPGLPWSIGAINASLPDTFSASYMQFWSKEWVTNFEVRYSLWKHAYSSFRLDNLPFRPGQTTVNPLDYKNSWSVFAFTRYQFADQWAGLVGVNFDSNPAPTKYRSLQLPTYQTLGVGVGLQYLPTKTTQIQFVYGHGMSDPKINNILTRALGSVKLRVNRFDLSFTYKY